MYDGRFGSLDKIDRSTQFVRFHLRARLDVPEGTPEEKARKLLRKAERSCLITNSLKAPSHLETEITVKAIAA